MESKRVFNVVTQIKPN